MSTSRAQTASRWVKSTHYDCHGLFYTSILQLGCSSIDEKSSLLSERRLSLMQCWYYLSKGTLPQHNAIADCPSLCNSVSSNYLEACQLVCLFCKRESEREENIQIWLSETKSEAKGHTGSANTGKHSAHYYADITDINGWIWTAWFKDMSQAEIGIPTWNFFKRAQVKQGKFWWYGISIPGQTHQHYRGKEGRGKGLTTYSLLHFQSCSPHHQKRLPEDRQLWFSLTFLLFLGEADQRQGRGRQPDGQVFV